MAAWVNANLHGVHVPQPLLEEMIKAGPEREAEVGIEIAARTVRAARKLCGGVHIMSIGWEHRIPDILRASVRP